MNVFPLKTIQWENHGVSKISAVYPLVPVSLPLKLQWVEPRVFNGSTSHSGFDRSSYSGETESRVSTPRVLTARARPLLSGV